MDAGGSSVQVTLTATNGAITLSRTTGLTFTAGDGTADATMTFTGTIANINTALNGLSFAPTANFNGAASLQIIDQRPGQHAAAAGRSTDTDTVTITVNAVNDAPVNNGARRAEHQRRHQRWSSPAANGNLISISDVDAGASSVQVTLTGDQRRHHAQSRPRVCRSRPAMGRPTRR